MFVRRLVRVNSLAIILGAGFLIGCGPSAEEQAATSVVLTAAAATSTPTVTPTHTPTSTSTHTPTPTPVPYDLSVLVAGEEEVPIIGASVVLAEIGDEVGTQITDDVGQAFWYDLPGETVNLSISAPGYFALEMTESIERGISHIAIALDRDPSGLLPSEACAPGERLLYIEDFQDGEAEGWEEIESRTQGWGIGPHPDTPNNIVLSNDGDQWAWTTLRNLAFENAVWRIQFWTEAERIQTFSWIHKENYEIENGTVEFSGYTLRFEPKSINVFRSAWPLSNPTLVDTNRRMAVRTWHLLEMSTFEGRLEIWIDGSRLVFYEDPDPLPTGTLALVFEDSPGVQSVYHFDDMSVCELTAPFGSLLTPES